MEESGDWIIPIQRYSQYGTLSKDEREATKVRSKSASFMLIGNELYKRFFTRPYLKCISGDEIRTLLFEVHEGVCENHVEGQSLSH